MKYWIVPSNDSTFRIGDAIKAQGGLVDWRTDKFSVGDIVFIYKTLPEKRIHYKMEVMKVKMTREQFADIGQDCRMGIGGKVGARCRLPQKLD